MTGPYLVKNVDNGKYLTYPGSKHTYTRSLKQARSFITVTEAKAYGLCGNEIIIELTSEIAQ